MLYNLINPSDPYTFEADDLELAAVAVVLLGDGQYLADPVGGGESVPAFLFGGHDEWFKMKFGESCEETANKVINERTDSIARALESVALTSKERSSMNDIGGRAHALARQIRDSYGKEQP